MTQPKTLLELSGAPTHNVDWNKAALILIDYQIEYINGSLSLGDRADACIHSAKKLMRYARDVQAPVIHVVQHGASGGMLFDPDKKYSEIVPELDVTDDESVIVKHLPNAFAKTTLRELLDLSGRSELIYAGFMSHMCVSSTVRAALDLGYKNIVCSDACYTRDLSDSKGNVVSAETVHEVSMAALRDRFATVATAAEIIDLGLEIKSA